MAARKRNDNRSGSNAGTVFWLASIVIALFIFALNWGKIKQTFEETHFHDIVKTQTGGDKAPDQPKAATDKALPAQPKAKPDQGAEQRPEAKPESKVPAKAAPQDTGAPAKSGKPEAEVPEESDRPIAQSPKPAKPPAGQGAPGSASPSPLSGAKSALPASAQGAQRSRSAYLYFVRIDDDGTIVRQEARRQIPASDSPLLDSMAALLKGPSEDEIRKHLISLVPEGTKLLSAQVRGSTAFLNFNEAFMYNHYGIEGYAGQLKQVVYTATAFPNVQDVQILIEGSKRDYLGGEGVYIGRPLSRNSF